MPDYTRHQDQITYAGAAVVLDAAIAKATDMGVPQCVAVVDAGGNLLAFARMEGAKVLSQLSSIAKAQSAASLRSPTGGIAADAELKLALATNGTLTNLKGGVPIEVDGEVIGAVGVGSGTGEQDREVADAGIAALVDSVTSSEDGDADDLLALLERDALRSGHFQLASGLHATRFFRAADLLGETAVASRFFDALAQQWSDATPAAVLGANEAGSVLAFAVGDRLGAQPVFARRSGDGYVLVGAPDLAGRDVLVVDDITTTGGTAKELVDLIVGAGGRPIGVGVLATKGLFDIDLGVETRVLLQLRGLDAHQPAECPACGDGVELTT